MAMSDDVKNAKIVDEIGVIDDQPRALRCSDTSE